MRGRERSKDKWECVWKKDKTKKRKKETVMIKTGGKLNLINLKSH